MNNHPVVTSHTNIRSNEKRKKKKSSLTKGMRKLWNWHCTMIKVAHILPECPYLIEDFVDCEDFKRYQNFLSSLPSRDGADRRLVSAIIEQVHECSISDGEPEDIVAGWPMAVASLDLSSDDLRAWAFRYAFMKPELLGNVSDDDENRRAFEEHARALSERIVFASLAPWNLVETAQA
jgi:hypothetical protein